MIEMRISHIPAKDTSDPWEVATAVVDGRKFVAKSQFSSCGRKLARMLVAAAAVPDRPWQSLTPMKAENQAVKLGGGDPATPDDMDLWVSAPAGDVA